MSLPRPLPRETAEALAARLRAIGHPLRLQLLDHIEQLPETTVRELGRLFEVSEQNVSAHLIVLRQAGIVTRHREGTHVRYRLADEHLIPLLEQAVAGLAEQAERLSRLAGSEIPELIERFQGADASRGGSAK